MPPNAAAPMVAARDFLYIAPEIVLAAWGLLVLTIDFALLRGRADAIRRKTLGAASLVGVVVALAVLYLDLPEFYGVAYSDSDPYLFFGTLAGDLLTSRLNLVLLVLLGLVVGMSMTWNFTSRWGEYFALLFWACVGMMLLVAADELITLFLTLEMMTLCLYMATAFETGRRRSAEAGLKYFVYGSVSSALFLFGLSLIYGLTGTTRLGAIRGALLGPSALGLTDNLAGAVAVLLVLVGFGFKVAAVPFHAWAPDAYEGAPAPVTAWIASGSKIASFVAMLKVLVTALGAWADRGGAPTEPGWVGIVALIAAVTMTYGNLAALAQRNFKRMLAYSAIGHAGYMLVGVLAAAVSVRRAEAAGAILYYLVIYGFTNVGAFAVAAWLARDRATEDIDDLNSLGRHSPGLAVCITLLMLSLIGVPPLAGFFGKLYMFMEALDAGRRGHPLLLALVGLALLNSVISAFYYVRVLKAMYLRAPSGAPLRASSAGIRWPILLGTLVAIWFGVLPSTLLEPMRGAARPLLMVHSGGYDVAPPRPVPAGRVRETEPAYTPEQLRQMQRRFGGPGSGGGPPAGVRPAPTPPATDSPPVPAPTPTSDESTPTS